MTNRWIIGLWILLLIAATFFVAASFALTQAALAPENSAVLALIVILWILTALGLIPSPLRRFVGVPLHWLRRHPILNWLFLLGYLIVAVSIWLVNHQPTNGRLLLPVEYAYLLATASLFIFLIGYDMHEPELRTMGSRLGKSKLTGVAITLTTLAILFFAGEAYLRIFYITTDGYGFTAMDYWWYQNFGLSHLNSLGFRDYEPTPNDPAHPLTRVAVLGDSFVMGHGINNIDDTFPQVLERKLGAGYDVNVIAKSGWDSDIELYELDSYPLRPNIVVLSYYLNDIDYLMNDPALNPDNNFAFPQNETLAWFIRSFFVPNYIYYDVMQFTSSTRSGNFANDLIQAHLNDDLWNKQVPRLYEMVAWAQRHDARLIVLVWPQLAAVDASKPATERVGDFFRSQGAQVVDMTPVLHGKSVGEITVNRFDAHPSVEADQIAAEQLYEAIMNKDQGS